MKALKGDRATETMASWEAADKGRMGSGGQWSCETRARNYGCHMVSSRRGECREKRHRTSKEAAVGRSTTQAS